MLPDNYLKNFDSLNKLWLTNFKVRNATLMNLPANLTNLFFGNGGLITVKSNAFENVKNLEELTLDRNKLSSFTSWLPKSLLYLSLEENRSLEISDNQWSNICLKYLYLDKNNLFSVPLGLPKTLEVLTLTYNGIEWCPPEAFFHLKRLKNLDLSHNKLTRMPTGIQNGITKYFVGFNSLSYVPGPEAYTFCSTCTTFSICGNEWICDVNFLNFLLWVPNYANEGGSHQRLTLSPCGRCGGIPKQEFTDERLQETIEYANYISKAPFTNCSYTPSQILECTNTNLPSFPKLPPDGTNQILINGNKDVKETPDFWKQTKLTWLRLEKNNLKRIPRGLPSSLILLSLRGNNITELTQRDVKCFQNLTNLKYLFLDKNNLKTVVSTDFTALKNLDYLGADNNDLVCDCTLMSFILWYKDLLRRDGVIILYGRTTCAQPERWLFRGIDSFGEWDYRLFLKCVPLECLWDEKSAVALLNCSISAQSIPRTIFFTPIVPQPGRLPEIPENKLWKYLILGGLELQDEDIKLNHLSRLEYVDLTNNSLTKWPLRGLPSSIKTLDLSKNNISRIPEIGDVQRYQPHIQAVNLRGNSIVTFHPEELKTLFLLESFQIAGNPFVCNCSALGSLIVWIRHNYSEFSGMIDSKIRRRRHRAQIMSGFQRLLQEDFARSPTTNDCVPEANVTFEYDAFVAFDEEDGAFIDKLTLELEQIRNRKLCLSSRDFIPGKDIADSIVASVQSSNRVILVLSKNFVTSPWCQYGVQIALAELYQRQKKLIVPILLENLRDDEQLLSASMKTFISLVQVTEAPKMKSSKREWERFWNIVEQRLDD